MGAYQRYGVSVYGSSKGELLWRRTDLKKVQKLKFGRRRNAVLAGIDQRAFRIVDARSGSDLETLRGIETVWESPFGSHLFKERRSGNHIVSDSDDPKKNINIERTSFGVLDACFTPEHIAVSEAGAATSLYTVRDGRPVWKYSERGNHNTRLAYCNRTREIVGINWRLKNGDQTIIAFDLGTGRITRRIPREDLAIASFALKGSCVVTWHGNVVDVSSGEVISRLDFG